MLVFVLLFFILFFYLSYKRPDVGVYLVLFSLPSYLVRFSFFVPFTLLEVMIIALFFGWFVRKVRTNGPSKIRPFLDLYFNLELKMQYIFLPVILFLISATVSMFISPDLRSAAGIWKAYFVEPFMFFMVFIDVIDNMKKIDKTVWAVVLSVLFPSLFALYQKITGDFISNSFWQNEDTRRVVSVYGYPNAIALYFVPVIIFGFILLKKYIRNKVLFLSVFLILCFSFLSVVFAKSKGGFIALAFALVVFVFVNWYRVWIKYWKRFLFISLAGLLIVFGVGYFLGVFETFTSFAGGGSWDVRRYIWTRSFDMLLDRPVLGAGLAGYQDVFSLYHTKKYIEIFLYPHNILLNFWSETGVLGVITFLWILYVMIKKAIYNIMLEYSIYKAVFLAYITAILVHGIVDVPYFKNDLSVFFWYVMGCIVVMDYLQYKNRETI